MRNVVRGYREAAAFPFRPLRQILLPQSVRESRCEG